MARWQLFLVTLLGSSALAGCSGAGERPSPYESQRAADPAGSEELDLDVQAARPGPDAGCADGTTRACKVTLPTHGEVESCYVGVELCVEGDWSECGDEAELSDKYYGG
jgi:hypothetical protein